MASSKWKIEYCKICRKQKIVARYGGEEFVIVLPHAKVTDALIVAERLRKTIENTPIDFADQRIHCTVSIGLDQAHIDGQDSGEALVARADQTLYRAKESGRNRVCKATDR